MSSFFDWLDPIGKVILTEQENRLALTFAAQWRISSALDESYIPMNGDGYRAKIALTKWVGRNPFDETFTSIHSTAIVGNVVEIRAISEPGKGLAVSRRDLATTTPDYYFLAFVQNPYTVWIIGSTTRENFLLASGDGREDLRSKPYLLCKYWQIEPIRNFDYWRTL